LFYPQRPARDSYLYFPQADSAEHLGADFAEQLAADFVLAALAGFADPVTIRKLKEKEMMQEGSSRSF
jgi:hypothetical protein